LGDILKDLDFCFAYLDDILVFSHSSAEHDQHHRILFSKIKDYGNLLNPDKCVFRVNEISFLCNQISSQVSQPVRKRLADLQSFPPPKTVGQLRRFLVMLKFYQRYLPRASIIQASLHDVLSGLKVKGSHPATWTDTHADAFDECIASFSSAAVLAHPDSTAPLAFVIDASTTVMGAILQQ
jgi:cleavage and polyadenylation specificity factor subunit 1